MIKIDELEDSLDKKAEGEFNRLLVEFEKAVKDAPGASININISLCRGEFCVNSQSYSKYSAISLLKLADALEKEGWPVNRVGWLMGAMGADGLYPSFEIKVLPGRELKRRAREKYQKGRGICQSIAYCFDNHFMATISCSMVGLMGVLLLLFRC